MFRGFSWTVVIAQWTYGHSLTMYFPFLFFERGWCEDFCNVWDVSEVSPKVEFGRSDSEAVYPLVRRER